MSERMTDALLAKVREDIQEGRKVSMGLIGNLLADLDAERQEMRHALLSAAAEIQKPRGGAKGMAQAWKEAAGVYS